MGFDNPLEKNMSVWGMKGKIIGVVKNFHMSSMYDPIEPLIIRYDVRNTSVAFIRTHINTQEGLQAIEKLTHKLSPAFPFQYEFLDREYEQAYKSEMTLSSLANIFALVSIFISCLGLLGLSAFSADQRAKEVGIRKVHGATIGKLVVMLSRDYTRLMLIAFIIAVPIAYYLMRQWLNDFTFRIELGGGIFIVAGLLTFLIGALTVGYKSYYAATANPVKSLKDE